MKQLLAGLDYMHKKCVIHRDIKGANVLISNDGVAKLADFGLARVFKKPLPGQARPLLTPKVCTLWYRAPELLLGMRKYDSNVDVWSMGCLMYELFSGRPLFRGKSDADQMDLIFKLCGTPSLKEWQGVESLEFFAQYWPKNPIKHTLKDFLAQELPNMDQEAMDLIASMCTINPHLRPHTKDLINHPFFTTEPLPC